MTLKTLLRSFRDFSIEEDLENNKYKDIDTSILYHSVENCPPASNHAAVQQEDIPVKHQSPTLLTLLKRENQEEKLRLSWNNPESEKKALKNEIKEEQHLAQSILKSIEVMADYESQHRDPKVHSGNFSQSLDVEASLENQCTPEQPQKVATDYLKNLQVDELGTLESEPNSTATLAKAPHSTGQSERRERVERLKRLLTGSHDHTLTSSSDKKPHALHSELQCKTDRIQREEATKQIKNKEMQYNRDIDELLESVATSELLINELQDYESAYADKEVYNREQKRLLDEENEYNGSIAEHEIGLSLPKLSHKVEAAGTQNVPSVPPTRRENNDDECDMEDEQIIDEIKELEQEEKDLILERNLGRLQRDAIPNSEPVLYYRDQIARMEQREEYFAQPAGAPAGECNVIPRQTRIIQNEIYNSLGQADQMMQRNDVPTARMDNLVSEEHTATMSLIRKDQEMVSQLLESLNEQGTDVKEEHRMDERIEEIRKKLSQERTSGTESTQPSVANQEQQDSSTGDKNGTVEKEPEVAEREKSVDELGKIFTSASRDFMERLHLELQRLIARSFSEFLFNVVVTNEAQFETDELLHVEVSKCGKFEQVIMSYYHNNNEVQAVELYLQLIKRLAKLSGSEAAPFPECLADACAIFIEAEKKAVE